MFLMKTEIAIYKHQISKNIKISISNYLKDKNYHKNTKSEKHESFEDPRSRLRRISDRKEFILFWTCDSRFFSAFVFS